MTSRQLLRTTSTTKTYSIAVRAEEPEEAAYIHAQLIGERGTSMLLPLERSERRWATSSDVFKFEGLPDMGSILSVRILHSQSSASKGLASVVV